MIINKSHIFIIIPSFNEGNRIATVINAIKEKGFENIIVIDDGSTDNSMALISNHGVTILKHLVNRGAGAATETGLKFCREYLHAETVVMIDADTQHDVNDITRLLESHFEQNADITIGNRFLESQNNIPRKNMYFNQLANIITSIFAGKRVYDSQSGFKVFNSKALKIIQIEHDKYEHCSEIFIKANKYGLKVIDVPVSVYYPVDIKDKGQHFSNGIRTFVNLLYSALFKSN